MKVVSVNVGLPRDVEWRGEIVTTGIFKKPVNQRVQIQKLNIEGDRQADLTVHGGEDKAIYVYPAEHYQFWREELPEMDLSWGMFGENITAAGLSEQTAHIGDVLRIGTAEALVTQPRLPCHKLGIRFGRPDIIKRFLHSRRTGFYLKVLREGEVATEDTLHWVSRSASEVSVADIVRVYAFDKFDRETMQRAVQAEALPYSWRQHFHERLEKLTSG